MVVPWPGRERTCKLPPAISSCWRMLASPKWLRPRWSPIGSARVGGGEAGPVVANLERHLAMAEVQGHPGVLGPGMLGDVGESFLGDPVQHRLLCSGQPLGQAGLDTAGDPRLLLEGLGVVAEGRRQPPFVQ